MPAFKELPQQAQIIAALQTLHTSDIQVRRLLKDRRGKYQSALIDYTVEDFAEKLVDGLRDAEAQHNSKAAPYRAATAS